MRRSVNPRVAAFSVVGIVAAVLFVSRGAAKAGLNSGCGLTASPNPAVAGNMVTFSGTGWAPGSYASRFRDTQPMFEAVEVDSNGEFTVVETLNNVGEALFRFLGTASEPTKEFLGDICFEEIKIRVDPPAAQLNPYELPPIGTMASHVGCFLEVSPRSATVEDEVSILAGGFQPGSPIVFNLGDVFTFVVHNANELGAYETFIPGIPITGKVRIQVLGNRRGNDGWCFPSTVVQVDATQENPGWDWGRHDGCTITVAPRSGPTGQDIQVGGFGFEPNTPVQLVLHGEPSTSGLADQDGWFTAGAATFWPIGFNEVKLAGTSASSGKPCFPRAFFETVEGGTEVDLEAITSFVAFQLADQQASLLPSFYADSNIGGMLSFSGSSVDLAKLPALVELPQTVIDLASLPGNFVFLSGDLLPAPIAPPGDSAAGEIDGPPNGDETADTATTEEGSDSESVGSVAASPESEPSDSPFPTALGIGVAVGGLVLGAMGSRLWNRRRGET